jgi:plasmid stability protein
MATLYIRGVPDALYDELKALAEADQQSVNAEALAIVEKGLQQRRIELQRRQALTQLDEIRQRIGPTRGDSLALLREDRER